MARKTWVLDTDTKGTGANVVPLEKVLADPDAPPRSGSPRRKPTRPSNAAGATRKAATATPEPVIRATPLPEGHVRKKATGEIGKIKAIDPRAGTATVRWLKSGSVSTVPLSSVSRR